MKKRMFALLLSCMMVFSLAACGNSEETVETETETAVVETETEKETFKAIGVEAEGVFCVKLKNSTGQDITGVAVKLMDEGEFSENMLTEDDVFEVDEERNLFYEKTASETEAETPAEDEKILMQGYDIQLTFADESIKVLHAFPFEDIEEGEILLEDEVAYIKYISITTGGEVSTKEAELATKQAEEAAQEEQVYEDDYTWYEEDYNTSWDNSGSSSGSVDNSGSGEVVAPSAPEVVVPEAPAQGTEECLGDDALTW